jgi:hypothetical protein
MYCVDIVMALFNGLTFCLEFRENTPFKEKQILHKEIVQHGGIIVFTLTSEVTSVKIFMVVVSNKNYVQLDVTDTAS